MALRHAEPVLALDTASSRPGGPGRSELIRRIWFTLGALIVFRVGTYVPIPGLDPAAVEASHWWDDVLHAFSAGPQWYESSNALLIINVFSGGGIKRMAIFALSVIPYLSALMIMHLAAAVWPAIGGWKFGAETGRRKFRHAVRYGTLLLATIQGYAVAVALENPGDLSPDIAIALALEYGGFGPLRSLVTDPGWFFRAQTAVTMACGTMFLVWLGEQITARGVGNGIALILFAGLVSQLPGALANLFELTLIGSLTPWMTLFILCATVGSTALIVFVERSRRRIVVQDPQRQAGVRMSGGPYTRTSLKLNGAGMLPPIFAALLMPVLLTLVGFYEGGGPRWLRFVIRQFYQAEPAYLVLYAALIFLFCFLCRPEADNPTNIARALERSGKAIGGIRPGRSTADYLGYVITRLTYIGAACLAGVCILPDALFPRVISNSVMTGTSLVIITLTSLDLLAAASAQSRNPGPQSHEGR